MKLTLTDDSGKVLQRWDLAIFGNMRKELPQRLLCRELLEAVSYWLPPETQNEQEGVDWHPLQDGSSMEPLQVAPTPQPAPVQKAKPGPTRADMEFVENFLSSMSPEELAKFLK